MEDSPQKSTGFPIAQAVIAVVVVLILAALVLPPSSGIDKARLTTALSNGRQIHQAVYRMVLDGAASEPPTLGWPGDLAAAKTNPITTSGQFVEYLVEGQYLERDSLAKLFRAPGALAYPGTGSFEGKYSPYIFFKVTEKDGDEVIFLATKNFHYGAPLDPKAPYGDRGCVIIRKSGEALSLTDGQARNKKVGLMPGGTTENPGVQEGNVLKD